MAKKKKAASEAAAALSKARWAKTTAEERSEIAQELNASRWAGKSAAERSEFARQRALDRANKLTDEERSAAAKKAWKTRLANGNAMGKQRTPVKLTKAQRDTLQKVIVADEKASRVKRARVLLLLDEGKYGEGLSDESVAKVVGISKGYVVTIRAGFIKDGI